MPHDTNDSSSNLTRRPIKVRGSRWAASIAAALARVPIKPNTISVFSVVLAAAAGACFALTTHWQAVPIVASALFIGGAVCVPLRLLCNLLDGMVAVECGLKTKSGEVFNELPDRLADAIILVGFGYAASGLCWGVELGWAAAVLAVITAYVRTLGAAVGAGQNFTGPMAKQQRMVIVTIAAVLSSISVFCSCANHAWIIVTALLIMIAGMLITITRRTLWIIRQLEAK